MFVKRNLSFYICSMGLKYTNDKKKLIDDFKNGFSAFLARKGYKTQDVAKILGVTDSAVSSWKYGRAFPDVLNLLRLFELGLSVIEITSHNYALSLIIGINNEQVQKESLERMVFDMEYKALAETLPKTKQLWIDEIAKEKRRIETFNETIEMKKKQLEKMESQQKLVDDVANAIEQYNENNG